VYHICVALTLPRIAQRNADMVSPTIEWAAAGYVEAEAVIGQSIDASLLYAG
jgi:hypothetical protein